MKIFHNIYIAFIVLMLSGIFFCFALFSYGMSSTSHDNSLNQVEISPGNIDSIANTLKKENFIRSKFCFKVYVKLTNKTNLKAGIYSLSKDMGIKKIVDILENGKNSGNIKITFKEGLNMRNIVKTITENTNNTEEMVYEVLNNKEYLTELISKYWFLTEDILNNDIYYSLEGYLYPSTYYFHSKETEVTTIFETMLDELENQLDSYKEEISSQNYTIHEILTLASIVELEGITEEDRKNIASVFYNRLDKNMNLGSDVTTYYSLKIDIGTVSDNELDLYQCNNYNTRCATFKKLPISPICNPSLESISAVLHPNNNDYLYFVADKNKKVYYSKTSQEHNNKINQLKKEGLWYNN